MVQEIAKNPDAVIGDFSKKDPVRLFEKKDALYTIGNQWKQRCITKIGDELFIPPAQYNLETGRWAPYHAHNWKQRPWLKNCGGCHVTGLDYEKRTFVEPGVGCEACHGPGDKHVDAKPGEFVKHIVNPASLPVGAAVQICGSCHTRGKDVTGKHGYPAGHKPGKTLFAFYKPVQPGKDKNRFWPDGSSKSHQQQIKRNPSQSHSIHDFGSCASCHMPRIVKSAESGDLHSHTFRVVEPKETVAAGGEKKQSNSCTSCHAHEDEDPAKLQAALDNARTKIDWYGGK